MTLRNRKLVDTLIERALGTEPEADASAAPEPEPESATTQPDPSQESD